jgi:hypothetical protein
VDKLMKKDEAASAAEAAMENGGVVTADNGVTPDNGATAHAGTTLVSNGDLAMTTPSTLSVPTAGRKADTVVQANGAAKVYKAADQGKGKQF